MSLINTGMAAGVAQTALQAQQVARQRDVERAQTQDSSARIRDLFDSHLKLFEESNRDSSPTHLHVDDQLPEHQSPPQEEDNPRRQPGQQPPAGEEQAAAAAAPPAQPDAPLYRHLDVHG